MKPSGALVFTAAQPFTSQLINSQLRYFKYCWVWEKSSATGWLLSKRQPLRAHEDVAVFYRKQCTYTPQMWQGKPYVKRDIPKPSEVYGETVAKKRIRKSDGLRYPRTVQYFKTAESEGASVHPTQKPVALMEYLIKTYTERGQTVLDCCMGSGTTGVAAQRTGRDFIGMEQDEHWFSVAQQRMADDLQLPLHH